MTENKKEKSLVEHIDILSIVKDVLRDWILILLVALAASLLANVYVERSYTPQYTCSSTFVVTSKGMNANIYQNLTSAQEMTASFSKILESTVLRNKVAEDLGVETVDAQMSVNILPETNLIELRVSAGSALEAYKVINSIMDNYSSVTDYVISNVILEVIKYPVIPLAASNPLNSTSVMKKVFLLAAAVMILILAVNSYLKDTVKNSRELEEKIDAKLLGTICHERKAKSIKEIKKAKSMSMLITNPLLSFGFVESNKMTAANVASMMDKDKAKVLMLTSVIENEGKSTVAANLALSLAQESKKVLLIDCDFRKPALYKIFEAEEEDIVKLPSILRGSIDFGLLCKQYKDTGLYTVFNKTSSKKMEKLLEAGGLQKFLELAREEMDYIILDTSPMALISDTEELAQFVDATVLVVRQDIVLAKDINDSIDSLEKANGKVLGCIFNDATRRSVGGLSPYGYGAYYGYGGRYGYGKRTD